MPVPDRHARHRSLRLRIAATLAAAGKPPRGNRRRADDPGRAAAPVAPDPAPHPLTGGAAATID